MTMKGVRGSDDKLRRSDDGRKGCVKVMVSREEAMMEVEMVMKRVRESEDKRGDGTGETRAGSNSWGMERRSEVNDGTSK